MTSTNKKSEDFTNKLKRKAKHIRSKRIVDSLEEGKWDPVKLEKRGVLPQQVRIRNEAGRIANDREKADTFAEFYESKQWKYEREEPAEQGMNRTPLRGAQNIDTEPVTMEELKGVIHKLKTNKAPGPNGTPIELFQWLDDGALEPLLTHINECWEKGEITEGTNDANVAVLFKKGSTENPENYRPIALLNTTYKILASIIQRRLAKGMDQAIDEMQFGFRNGRNTSQPLQIVRRTAEIFEEPGAAMYMLLIDWEKAFDKVDQERLIFALETMGIPQTVIGIIRAIYEKPNFAVKDRGRTSTRRRQKAGIRQGCPLSPYLFGISMTVIMEDVEKGLTEFGK